MMRHVVVLSLLVVFCGTAAIADVPGTISYQGVLADAAGNPVPDGNVSLTFALYDVATGGTPVWTETQTVAVARGVFSVNLGAVTPLLLAFEKPFWLAISVNGGAALTPRSALTSSPYSLAARDIAGDGKVVRAVNRLTDSLVVLGEGGTAVTVRGDTLVVTSVPPGSGTAGIFLIQDPAGSLSIVNPNGPNTNISVAPAGIVRNHIAGNQVVKSLNGLADFLEIIAGQNVRVTTLSGLGPNGVRIDAFPDGGNVGGDLVVAGNLNVMGGSDHAGKEIFRDGIVLSSGQDSLVLGPADVSFYTFGNERVVLSPSGLRVPLASGGSLFANGSGVEIRDTNNQVAWMVDDFGRSYHYKPERYEDTLILGPRAGIKLALPGGRQLTMDARGIRMVDSDGLSVDWGVFSDGTSYHYKKEYYLDTLELDENAAIRFPDGSVMGTAGSGIGGVFKNTPLVVEDSTGAETFRVNPDGTSFHYGTEFFEDGMVIFDHPGPDVGVMDTAGQIVAMLDAREWIKVGNDNPSNELPAVTAGKGTPEGAAKPASLDWRLLTLPVMETGLARTAAPLQNEGPVIFGYTSRPAGAGILGYATDASNTSPAIWGVNEGGGSGLLGQVLRTASNYPGVWALTSGVGSALLIDHQGSTGNLLTARSGGTNMARIDKTGKGFFNGGTQTGGADVAEAFDVEGHVAMYEPGDVLAISPDRDRTVRKSDEPYSLLVAGVYATKPGVLLTEKGIDDSHDSMVPMGIVGVLPTRVSSENGPIRRGDLLVTSGSAGCAMKGTDRSRMVGAVLGKALENFDGEGIGVIKVLVNTR